MMIEEHVFVVKYPPCAFHLPRRELPQRQASSDGVIATSLLHIPFERRRFPSTHSPLLTLPPSDPAGRVSC